MPASQWRVRPIASLPSLPPSLPPSFLPSFLLSRARGRNAINDLCLEISAKRPYSCVVTLVRSPFPPFLSPSLPPSLPPSSFGGNTGHDPHLLYTLSAIQILAIADELHKVDQEKVAKYVLGLQQVEREGGREGVSG